MAKLNFFCLGFFMLITTFILSCTSLYYNPYITIEDVVFLLHPGECRFFGWGIFVPGKMVI